MAPPTFSVSEVRVAAACPRVSYFDADATRRSPSKTRAMTRLWKAGDGETACGTLFHNAVEAFNRRASRRPRSAPRSRAIPIPAQSSRPCVPISTRPA